MSEEIAVAEVLEVAQAEEKTKPRSTDEKAALVDGSRSARTAHIMATAKVLSLKDQLRTALVEEARALNDYKAADATLRKEVEGEP